MQLLYPLEVRSTSEAEETQDEENEIVEPVEKETNQVKGIKRPRRVAAMQGEELRKKWIEELDQS